MDDIRQAEYLAKKYANTILRLGYTYVKNVHDAQDVCQTVFLKLLTHPQTFESEAHEKAYILRMTANICKNMLRSPWRSKTCSLDVCADIPVPEPADNLVLDAVNALPARYRSVVYLHYYEGYRAEEIAEILEISPSAVYTRLNRARAKLKKTLGGADHEALHE